jgi:OOP family OmpA-OmpF porin
LEFADPDDDGDGVPNHLDECRRTPLGALVDERGCWVGAYDAFFDVGRAELKPRFTPYIEEAADVLKAHPNLTVRLEGHTDNTGSAKLNLDLGLKRALAVRQALVAEGVPARRMKFISYGQTKPIASNRTAKGRAQNRRVEITVLNPGSSQTPPGD